MPKFEVGGEKGGWEGFVKTQEMLNDDGYIYYLDHAESFMGICIFQTLPNYTPKMCSLFCHLYFNKAENNSIVKKWD